ncbi:MAG: Rieske (2Fe-2S) protein [Anaerolineae bacterium]|nr:Rieske (2Fe-2S) protein [Phycisphaerae bacterium]
MNRREFVVLSSVVAAGCACAFCGAEASAAPEPTSKPASKPAAGATGPGKVDIGKLSDYSADGITEKFMRPNKFAVVRTDGKIFATSARCTHKASPLRVKDGHFACPSHGSEFSTQGTVTKGPAKDSLVRYAITKTDAGSLIVDTNKSFREKDWEKPQAFVSVT